MSVASRFALALGLGAIGFPTALGAEETKGWGDLSRVLRLSAEGVRYERYEEGAMTLRLEAESVQLNKSANAFEFGPFRLQLPNEADDGSFEAQLEAQQAVYALDDNRLEAEQTVKAQWDEGRLEARSVEVDWSTQRARFAGPIRSTSKNGSMACESLDLYWPDKRIRAESVKMTVQFDEGGEGSP